MARSFKPKLELTANWIREPKFVLRIALGVLLAANLVAAWMVFYPVGGSAEELDAQIATLRVQMQQRQASVARLQQIVGRVEQARLGTDKFLSGYFLTSRTKSSTVVSELIKLAKESGMRPKEHAFAFDPIEGSDDLSMMTITGGYEGTYGDLVQFMNRLDKSPRFLIVDSLNASPIQGSKNLAVALKMNTFVREDNAIRPTAAAPQAVAQVHP
jgi:Tfp pilus assembly protein PilO